MRYGHGAGPSSETRGPIKRAYQPYGVDAARAGNRYQDEIQRNSGTERKRAEEHVRDHACTIQVSYLSFFGTNAETGPLAGATNYGLSMALASKITLKNGAVEQHNFYDFLVMRMDQAPRIDVYAVPSNAPPSGIGEPATTPIAPAVASAIFKLTGKRIRTLPFSDA